MMLERRIGSLKVTLHRVRDSLTTVLERSIGHEHRCLRKFAAALFCNTVQTDNRALHAWRWEEVALCYRELPHRLREKTQLDRVGTIGSSIQEPHSYDQPLQLAPWIVALSRLLKRSKKSSTIVAATA